MDTTKPSASSFSPAALASLLDGPKPPLLIDVRKNPAFAESPCMLPGALRRDPLELARWATSLPPAARVVVYCVHGHEVSCDITQALRQQGLDAHYLEGGIEAWREQALPVVAKPPGADTSRLDLPPGTPVQP